ncbi:metal-sensitive transcriptional regulator [Corynebacterium qintianiae]|uniref:Metal-sensitive transcriptional regulator n=1 Tax=Corynebacterium qintianiae TaxID=2709392 RepID=A0A7T0KLX2_9CORY|nr:metal-sensitive transcriptional regulator [Corynebacterium qintianiae]QPK82942.1 metal-sensitive transcriptional regulator [Corynebacterium qintianiae]
MNTPDREHRHGYSHDKDRYSARLKRVEGQVRGIQRMIEEDQYCIDILTQITAITSALENVGLSLLDEHLKHCVAGAVHSSADGASGDAHTAVDAKVEEAMQAIKRMVKS